MPLWRLRSINPPRGCHQILPPWLRRGAYPFSPIRLELLQALPEPYTVDTIRPPLKSLDMSCENPTTEPDALMPRTYALARLVLHLKSAQGGANMTNHGLVLSARKMQEILSSDMLYIAGTHAVFYIVTDILRHTPGHALSLS